MEKQTSLDQYEGFEVPRIIKQINEKNRLFLPLNDIWYKLFLNGNKCWELRGVNEIFNSNTIWKGRIVELRRGYKYGPVWGVIENQFIVKSLHEIPKEIFDKTIPNTVQNDSKVIDFLENYSKKYDELILFKITIDDRKNK